MAIPEDHLKRLEENLSAQEHWLPTLKRHIAGLLDEASAIETMLALGRDQRLLRVLEELYDQPKLFERACDEPRAFFEERGVRLPDDAIVTVNRDPGRHAVEARFVMETLSYGAGWSPRVGFYAIDEPPPSFVTGI